MEAPSERTESLLAQAGWIRRLAHHLVRDPDQADDLVQDTWVAALRHPPQTSDSVATTRSFLGKVLRNTLLHSARGDRHRRAREHEHAQSEIDTGSAELVGEVESQRVVLEEVLQLPEPYRTTVLMRYFRELSAADIARAQDVPPATVRSRLKRALEQLRERLDARHGGDRSAWSLGILAWAREAPPVPPPPVAWAPLSVATVLEGIIAMKVTKIAVLAGITAIAAFGVARWQRTPADAAPPVVPAVASPNEPQLRKNEAEQPATPLEAPSRTAVAAEPAVATNAPVEPAVAAEIQVATLTALFVDDAGFALPGVMLELKRFTNGSSPARVEPVKSGGDGRVELQVAVPRGSFAIFWCRAEGHLLTSVEAQLDPGRTTDLGTIELRSGTPVTGRVVDPEGRAVEGARVWALSGELPEDESNQAERRGPASITNGILENDDTPGVRSDADGHFRIPGVAVGAARVWAHTEESKYCASAPFEVAAGLEEVEGIEVVLRPLDADDRIEGIVLKTDGTPLPGAQVSYAMHDEGIGISSSVSAREDGRFRLVLWRKVPHTFTVRGEDGQGNAHVANVPPGTLDLVLRLGDEEAFELVVTDPDGRPVEDFRVMTCVGTEMDWTGREEHGDHHPGGRIRVGLPAETFFLEVSAVGFALGKPGLFEPSNVPAEVALVLQRAPGVSGHVYVDGVPRSGVRVCLYESMTGGKRHEVNGFTAFWRQTMSDATTGDDGAFIVMPREEGEFIVRAELEGWAPAESASMRLTPTTGASNIDLHLTHGGTLVVQVTAPPGKDAAGVIVAVNRFDGHARTLRSDPEGRAVFENLTPGRWNVAQANEEIKPFTTSSSTWDTPNAPEPERPWVVEVLADRTTRYTLVLTEEQD